jgi:ABC-type Fe3+-hydroxamate transport system substrate-binding protein
MATAMIELQDDLLRTIRLPSSPQRIVSLVPSITETLFELGAGNRIVGVTDYCIHPAEEVRSKARIGGPKNFRFDAVLALKPELVIANAEENRKPHIEKLEGTGLPVFVTFPKDVEGCLKMIGDMAGLTNSERAAAPILAAIRKAAACARDRACGTKIRVLCPVWKDPYMTINRETFVDSVLRACGGRNVFSDLEERYPVFTLEEAARLLPEVILLPTEPYHFSEKDQREFEAAMSRVPAIRNRRIHIVEGELLSWYGPRLARALIEISKLLHPEPPE